MSGAVDGVRDLLLVGLGYLAGQLLVVDAVLDLEDVVLETVLGFNASFVGLVLGFVALGLLD